MDFGSSSTPVSVAEVNTSLILPNLAAEELEGSATGDHAKTPRTPQKTGKKRVRGPYKGARLRDGKWVSEIRIPKRRERIWLGYHESAEKAARAYVNALYNIHVAELNGAKSSDEIKRFVQGLASVGASRVRAPKHSSKPLPIPKPLGSYSTDLHEMSAAKVRYEPNVSSEVMETDPYIPALNLATSASEAEPYVTIFVPEEPPIIPLEDLPFDEEFIKGSDDWILHFMADP